MTFRSKLIEQMARKVIEEYPPRPAVLEERLKAPRTEECRRMLAVIDVVLQLDLGDGFKEFLPAVRRVLEDQALECEYGAATLPGQVDGPTARARANAILAGLQRALDGWKGPA
ncbi:MAG TPA: hypothetical protein VHI93_01415 [Candidatus Thermoplasmatota archaeon]|nr:hypothetical protein [Candidatus Thermoplasmatota archaeon]